MSNKSVSVIMPVLNGGETIDAAIESILAQRDVDIELIVVDDGSTDETPLKLKNWRQKDPRLIVITQKHKGIVAALNRGIDQASTELIARCDADDLYMFDKLKLQINVFDKNPNIVLVSSAARILFPGGNIARNHYLLTDKDDLWRSFYIRNPFIHGATMFRKSTFMEVAGYNANIGPVEDYDLWIRLHNKGDFAALHELAYTHLENPDGVSRKHFQEQQAATTIIQDDLWQKPPEIYGPVKTARKLISYRRIPLAGLVLADEFLSQQLEITKCFLVRGHKIRALIQLISLAFSSLAGLKLVTSRLLSQIVKR